MMVRGKEKRNMREFKGRTAKLDLKDVRSDHVQFGTCYI